MGTEGDVVDVTTSEAIPVMQLNEAVADDETAIVDDEWRDSAVNEAAAAVEGDEEDAAFTSDSTGKRIPADSPSPDDDGEDAMTVSCMLASVCGMSCPTCPS